MRVVPLSENRFDEFAGLINALADYEKLPRPEAAAAARMRADAFGSRRRFEAALAVDDADRAVGYAIWFETYSTFLAKPTMYLEDLFVLEEARGTGAGGMLFDHVRALGEERGCGRMEWQVLDWNTLARDFYHRRNAQWMKEWLLYRISYSVLLIVAIGAGVACMPRNAQREDASSMQSSRPTKVIEHVAPARDSVGGVPERFEWTAIEGADQYVLALWNEVDVLVWRRDDLRAASVTRPPGLKLEWGTYFWSVTALRSDQPIADSGRAAFVVVR